MSNCYRGALLFFVGLFLAATPAAAQPSIKYGTVARGTPAVVDPNPRFGGGTNFGIDASGNLYVLSSGVQRVTPAGVVSTIVSTAGVNTVAIAVDASGNSYVGEQISSAIYRITPAGDRSQFANGGGIIGAMAFDASGTLYVAGGNSIFKIVSGSTVRVAGGTSDFDPVDGMAFDAAGNLFVVGFTNIVRKITPDGTTTTIAGARNIAGSTDGFGTAARFNRPTGITVDAGGNLFIADSANHTVRRVGTDGAVTTVAGIAGTSGTADGPAASATFSGPYDVVFDGSGTLNILDGSLRKLSGGTVVTFVRVAPTTGGTSDLSAPRGVAVLPAGVRLVSDAATHSVQMFSGIDATQTVAAGRPRVAGSADGLAGPTARLGAPTDIVFDQAGAAYVADGSAVRRIGPDGTTTTVATGTATSGSRATPVMTRHVDGTLYVAESCTVRKITPAGVVTLLAGGSSPCVSTDGTGSSANIGTPDDIAVDAAGVVFFVENQRVRRITPDGVVTTIAGGGASGSAGVDGTGSSARFRSATGLAIAPDGTIYVADGDALRRVTPAGDVTTVAGVNGTTGSADGDGSAARFTNLTSITFGTDGVLYAMDAFRLRSITTSGHVVTLAGDLSSGQADGTGAAARFTRTIGMGTAPDGLLFIVQADGRVRTATTAGAVSTYVSGTGSRSDGALFATARFNAPTGLAATSDGGVVIVADTGNHTIRKIAANVASTLAGGPGVSGLADGAGTAARFSSPQGVAIDANGVVYVADTGNSAVRKIATDGTVTTVPGGFVTPKGIAVDAAGTIYLADTGNHIIRSISSSGAMTTIAGTEGVSGSTDGTGAAARFSSPAGLALAPDGTIYVADTGNSTIRAIAAGGVVTTVGGAAGPGDLADGTGTAARFNGPEAMAVDSSGAGLSIADTGNAALRLGIVGTGTKPVFTLNPASRSVSLHGTVQLTCAATGAPTPAIRWEWHSTSSGLGSIADNEIFSGVDTAILTIANAPASLNGSQLRCVAYNGVDYVRSLPATVTVRLLTVAPSSLNFNLFTRADGAVLKTSDQTVTVGWQDSGAPPWTVTANQPWVQVTNGSGAGAGTFTVGITDPFAGTSATQATATLTLTSSADPQFTVTIPVRAGRLSSDSAPIGVFDTPANNATGLQGSLAVTGWALDDIEMDHVEIWRDRVAGETTPVYDGSGPGNGKIFIANAMMVPGARPDVEASIAGARPGARNAGWGYMLLTQGLWNEGNGTYMLYAFAFDKAGASSTIGTKTITVDNANATRPFGTIDTPSYGGTVSGVVTNFGWALTPGPTCTITNPNVQVSIDSGPLTPVTYGSVRPDVAGAFPAYTNAAAAGGHSTLDTTTLTNGMHTIGWMVTDSCGRADGVGSRFFTVANASSTAAPQAAVSIANPSRDFALMRMGGSETETPEAAADGTRVIRVGQAERIELQLPGASPYVADGLPLGSSFDAAEGKFSWQPAAGFLGAYDLRFTAQSRVEKVRVVIGPPIRMVIDTAQAGTVLAASGFTIAGWAVDLASLDGAGIDTLHTWAYPVGGGSPVFVGVAAVGGARPDVARLYGAAFGDAGFTLNGALAPGTYDLVVYAHSAASNRFAGAETLRVVVR